MCIPLGCLAARGYGRRLWHPYYRSMAGGSRTHEQVLREIGPRHRPVLERRARDVGIRYPPRSLTLLGLKDEKRLEVWAPRAGAWVLYRSFPVLAASGGPGPKLREGDLQVPEGLYRLTHFNPNSSYHLSVRVDYPNAFDRARAREDGRTRLGGDIYIHGKAVSIGCLAIGDDGIEELLTLLADTGLSRVRLVLAPSRDPAAPPSGPRWLPRLYEELRAEIHRLARVPRGAL